MIRLRNRLFLLSMALIGFSVLLSGIYAANLLRQAHIDTVKDSMLREIRLILVSMPWKTDGSFADKTAYFAEKAGELKQAAGVRVTFIQADGTVLADTDYDSAAMENHLTRREIAQADKSGVGSSIRFSDTLGRNMLYEAVAVRSDGRLQGFVRLAVSLDDAEAAVRKLWTALIAGLLVLFALAGLVSYRLARQLTRPLERIAETAGQIAQMNYHARVEARGKDELGLLGHAVNRMAESLQQQMKRIRAEEMRLKGVLDTMLSGVVMIEGTGSIALLNKPVEDFFGLSSEELLGKHFAHIKMHPELCRLIEECFDRGESVRDEIILYYPRERTVEINLVPMRTDSGDWSGIVLLLHDTTALRRLERMRSEFVANVSHELKTPIAAVQGFAETLLAGAMNDGETARAFLQIIFDESKRLNRLIGDILELSKIESQRAPLQFSPIQLHAFVVDTIEMMRAEALKKRIGLQMDVPHELFLEADEDRLRQILINLLSNAVNYTPDGGEVSIRAKLFVGNDGNEWIRLIVEDSGIGIPKKDIPRIFERFYRVDKARSRSSGGTGLGLSIVKHLVELHQGFIDVESQVGVGTAFRIDLPVIQPFAEKTET